jgi:hypothetical protein
MAMIMPSAHEISPVLEELNHDGPTLAIDPKEIFKPERPGGKAGFTLRAIGATGGCGAVTSIRFVLRTAAAS